MKSRKKNIALHYTVNVEHEHAIDRCYQGKRNIGQYPEQCHKIYSTGGSVSSNIDELLCDEPGYMMARPEVMIPESV